MLIIPAIDIKDGEVVRLRRGEFDKVKVYSKDPVSVARKWESEGAKLLHVVDLDGALSGELKNLDVVKKIAGAVSIPLQVGGGIRSEESIEKVFSSGVRRVVLGTAACEDDMFVQKVIGRFGEGIVVSIDARDGVVATEGWTKTSDIKAQDLVKKLELLGLRVVVCTDISRDGTLAGPNIEALKEILKVREKILVISSGGVSSVSDLLQLKELEPQGVFGAIVGKALYEEKIDLAEAIKQC